MYALPCFPHGDILPNNNNHLKTKTLTSMHTYNSTPSYSQVEICIIITTSKIQNYSIYTKICHTHPTIAPTILKPWQPPLCSTFIVLT